MKTITLPDAQEENIEVTIKNSSKEHLYVLEGGETFTIDDYGWEKTEYTEKDGTVSFLFSPKKEQPIKFTYRAPMDAEEVTGTNHPTYKQQFGYILIFFMALALIAVVMSK